LVWALVAEATMSQQRLCPICRKPSVPEQRPFCSARCKDLDLQRWFAGRYAIPVTEAGEPEPPEDPL
jgi:endogenous inhibitor of DNA gyrase (YacG/DUF329 family)